MQVKERKLLLTQQKMLLGKKILKTHISYIVHSQRNMKQYNAFSHQENLTLSLLSHSNPAQNSLAILRQN